MFHVVSKYRNMCDMPDNSRAKSSNVSDIAETCVVCCKAIQYDMPSYFCSADGFEKKRTLCQARVHRHCLNMDVGMYVTDAHTNEFMGQCQRCYSQDAVAPSRCTTSDDPERAKRKAAMIQRCVALLSEDLQPTATAVQRRLTPSF